MPSTRSLLSQARDRFIDGEHRIDVLHGPWQPMVDDHGQPLPGIRGRPGAAGITIEGHEIGADLIEMQPGSEFPLHVHPGDHILFGVSGAGNVLIERERRLIYPGVTVFIAAEFVHGVGTYARGGLIPFEFEDDPLVFRTAHRAWIETRGVFTLLAVGVPHKHVTSAERMTVVE